MTMLDILKSRLPADLSVTVIKEYATKYKLAFIYKGDVINADLLKNWTPDKVNEYADNTIRTAMLTYSLNKNDMDETKRWSNYKYVAPADDLESRLKAYCVKEGITKDEAYRRAVERLLNSCEL